MENLLFKKFVITGGRSSPTTFNYAQRAQEYQGPTTPTWGARRPHKSPCVGSSKRALLSAGTGAAGPGRPAAGAASAWETLRSLQDPWERVVDLLKLLGMVEHGCDETGASGAGGASGTGGTRANEGSTRRTRLPRHHAAANVSAARHSRAPPRRLPLQPARPLPPSLPLDTRRHPRHQSASID